MNIVERAKAKWNKQADEYNQWEHLGTAEKLDLIIAEESSNHTLLEEAVKYLKYCRYHAGYVLYPTRLDESGHNKIAREIDSFLTRAKERLG